MVKLRGKIIIAAIVVASIALSAYAIRKEYKIEHSQPAPKAEELEESPAEVVQVRPLAQYPKTVKVREPEVVPVETVIEEIAPVQEEKWQPHEEIPLADEYQEWIESECDRLQVNKAYIYALIESESSFCTGLCVSDGGGQSAGLCQINSVNWPDMEKKGLDPFDEFDNITYCISMVSKLINKYADADDLINTVTTCYKAGEKRAKELNYYLKTCDKIKDRMNYFATIIY